MSTVLYVADQVPFPQVKGGVEGRLLDYVNGIFGDLDALFVFSLPELFALVARDRTGRPIDCSPLTLKEALCLIFEVDNVNCALVELLLERYPCFSIEQACTRKSPVPFRGVVCNYHGDELEAAKSERGPSSSKSTSARPAPPFRRRTVRDNRKRPCCIALSARTSRPCSPRRARGPSTALATRASSRRPSGATSSAEPYPEASFA